MKYGVTLLRDKNLVRNVDEIIWPFFKIDLIQVRWKCNCIDAVIFKEAEDCQLAH